MQRLVSVQKSRLQNLSRAAYDSSSTSISTVIARPQLPTRKQFHRSRMERRLTPIPPVPDSNASCSPEARNRQLRDSLRNVSPIDATRNAPILPSTVDIAVVHLTIAIRAARIQAEDAWGIAIAALKNLGITVMMKAAMVWLKSHPWETAALIVPMLLTACAPALLGLVGFTAGGIATGSIAAGIQAGIGNVAAGSVFATLTSAAMSGYGAPVVFGGVWGFSSVVCWGLAAWKKSRRNSERACAAGRGNDRTDGEGAETAKLHKGLVEE